MLIKDYSPIVHAWLDARLMIYWLAPDRVGRQSVHVHLTVKVHSVTKLKHER
jgi:hypothetical protein